MQTMVEFPTPTPLQVNPFLDFVSRLDSCDCYILSENGGVSSVVIGEKLRERTDRQIFLKVSCSNRNRIALFSELSTAASLGFSNVVLADGAHPVTTKFPAAKPVYDLDAVNLLRLLKDDSSAVAGDVPALREMARWRVGVCIGGATEPDLSRAERFLSGGADLILAGARESVRELKRLTAGPVILSIPKSRVGDFPAALQEAKTAGADGVNIIFEDDGEENWRKTS